MLGEWYGYRTNCEITGSPQYGKSKAAEHFMREHAVQGNGFALVDFHGTLYDSVLNYLAYLRPRVPIVLFNPSYPARVAGFNPFRFKEGDVSAHVDRLSDTILKPWGHDPNLLPTYERIVKMVLTLAAVSGEPVHHCAKLLEYPKKELREWAISVIENDTVKQNWKQLQYLSLLRNGYERYLRQVESTQNRLARFVESDTVKLFTGIPGSIDIEEIVDSGAILLVNLKPSPYLSAEAARTFAALILSEFFNSAMYHTDEERPYFAYFDECQNYLSSDAAPMLDQVPKTGLRLTLIHHHAGQFHDQPHLLESLRMSCQIRLTFGGLSVAQAKMEAEEHFLSELNERLIKEINYRTVTKHREDRYETETHTTTNSGSEGMVGEQESFSVTNGSTHSVQSSTRFVPYYEKEETGKVEWSREEKLSKLAERLTSLPRQHCYVKLPDDAFRWKVPWVEAVLLDPDTVLQFEEQVQPDAIPFHEAREILKQQEHTFLERSRSYVAHGRRPKKKPARLHPQD